MNTANELLQTILANPEDDACRLVFADLLEENGEGERAEFIRIQIELARMPQQEPTGGTRTEVDSEWNLYCERWNALRARERELLDHYGYGWCDGLLGGGWKTAGVTKSGCEAQVRYTSGTTGTEMVSWLFSRGHVHSIRCSFYFWRTHHAAIQAATPLRKCRLKDLPNDGTLIAYNFAVLHGSPSIWTSPIFPGIEFELPAGFEPAAEYAWHEAMMR